VTWCAAVAVEHGEQWLGASSVGGGGGGSGGHFDEGGGALAFGSVFVRVGVGSGAPVVDHLAGVGEAQDLALLDEELFVVGEAGVAPRLVGFREEVDVVGGEVAGGEGGGDVGHAA